MDSSETEHLEVLVVHPEMVSDLVTHGDDGFPPKSLDIGIEMFEFVRSRQIDQRHQEELHQRW